MLLKNIFQLLRELTFQYIKLYYNTEVVQCKTIPKLKSVSYDYTTLNRKMNVLLA